MLQSRYNSSSAPKVVAVDPIVVQICLSKMVDQTNNTVILELLAKQQILETNVLFFFLKYTDLCWRMFFFCFFAAQLIISLINRDPQIYQTLCRDLIAPDKTTFNCTYSSSNQLHLTQRQYNAAYTLLLQY